MKKTGSVSNSLVVGIGEVGTAIASILECDGIDKGETAPRKSYKFLHICFPYNDEFILRVKSYQLMYSPDYTIIHSTVKIGTARQCDAVSSVIRGKHPELEKGIRTFTKYFGGADAFICAGIFSEKGIKVRITSNPEDIELLKLIDTLQYGLLIMIEKEIYKLCQEKNVDFNLIYTEANKEYNRAYTELGMPEVVRPYLKHIEGSIGGHCIIQNAHLLKGFWLADLLINNNRIYEKEFQLSELPQETKEKSYKTG